MPTTRYLSIKAVQEPFDSGTDDQQRLVYRFNILVEKASTSTFVEEIIEILEDAGVGTRGTNIFWTSRGVEPRGAGPFLRIVETGGMKPDGIHGDVNAIRRPGAQITVRAETYELVKPMIFAAYDALVGIRNQDIVT